MHFLIQETLVFHLELYRYPILLSFFSQFFLWISMSFVFFSVLGSYFYYPIIRIGYQLASFWLGTMYWLLWASAIIALISIILRLYLHSFQPLPLTTLIFFLAALGISIIGTIHTHTIHIRHFTVPFKNLPKLWNNTTIVLVADTHFGHVWGQKRAEKIASLIQEQNPDLVLIPGDFYDGPPADYEMLARPFGAIQSTYGSYFCAGNHEQFRPSTPYTDALKKNDITVLTNEKVVIDDMQIIGVSYLNTRDAETTTRVLENIDIDPVLPSILLKHVPKDPEATSAFGIDLQVSGHTHNGQMWPFNLMTHRIFHGFENGFKQLARTSFVTTSGAGTWGPMQRVGTDSEIIIIHPIATPSSSPSHN